jgi:hypothetical protein
MDHQDALARVTIWAGVIEHVEQVASLDCSDHSLETEAPLGQQQGIFLVAPDERTHPVTLASRCA